MNSCLYKATVMHHRLKPKKHRFYYKVFMFYIDLDEIELLRKNIWMFSYNRFNFFSLRDNEHLQLPINNPDKSKTTKQHIVAYLKQNNMDFRVGKIMLLTNLNVLGYNFNPVSFYYCFDENNKPVCSIAEVGNTFGEIKPYLLSKENLTENTFHLKTIKYFYVSPFIEHDTSFDFKIDIPDEKLKIHIDDYKEQERFFISTLTGNRKPMTNSRLFWYSVRFPFITLKIIVLIHWHALLLWLKKLHFYKKEEHQDLQRDVYRRYRK